MVVIFLLTGYERSVFVFICLLAKNSAVSKKIFAVLSDWISYFVSHLYIDVLCCVAVSKGNYVGDVAYMTGWCFQVSTDVKKSWLHPSLAGFSLMHQSATWGYCWMTLYDVGSFQPRTIKSLQAHFLHEWRIWVNN